MITYYVNNIPNAKINGVSMYCAVESGKPVCYGGRLYTDSHYVMTGDFSWVLGLNANGRPVCRFERVPSPILNERHWITESYEAKD
ncbi:MAG: hypothetical protein GOVbin631_43 [Prokaryotic dsDNA virus sp.]|nr:MAG: hypothetical protein GOVbin631_43 [Prokaryotic dsDNA virus sp.]|tara:strand:+ start:16733 stop:16990 length:258 start_codon:yes stop_codon:yes gene_type:complete